MLNPRTTRRLAWIGVPVALLVALAAVWNWDWFIPIIQSRASTAIGRPVTISHLHLRLGRVVTVTADGVVVANPPDWPNGDPPFVSIKSLTIQADAWGYVRGHGLGVPLIGIDGPRVLAAETKEGAANFRLSTGGGGGGSLKIGAVQITDGDAHAVIPPLKSDFNAKIETQGDGDASKLVVDAKGTYAAQPITARLVGGALLSLRDAKNPWPVEMNVENGPTHVSLDGTLQDPVAFEGADVRLRFNGPDMGLLEPLVGFPIPKTAAYQIAGKLDVHGLDWSG
jgi:AsmA family protein